MANKTIPFTSEHVFASIIGSTSTPKNEAISLLKYQHSGIRRKTVLSNVISILGLLKCLFGALSVILFLSFAAPANSQITTIDFQDYSQATTCDRRRPPPLSPPCVAISNQYASQGIVFLPTPNYPVVVWEDPIGPWPVPPPYLGGGPNLFFGPIQVQFVDTNNAAKNVARTNVQIEGCGFDTVGSTTVYWLDVNQAGIGSQTNQHVFNGDVSTICEPMVAPGPVGGFYIQITCTGTNCEPAGYNIDNIQFGPAVYCSVVGASNCNHDPSNDKNLGSCENSVGNPCNPGTGNKFQRETDYEGPTMSFSRSYNSGLGMDIGLGYGWTSNFRKQIEFYIDHSIRTRREDGRSYPFYFGSNQWGGEPDFKATLVQNSSGYVLTLPEKTVETYDLTGRIVSETDRTGKSIAYTYNGSGQLIRVTDTFGMSFSFAYGADGRLQSFTDPAGSATQYTYDALGNLTSATDANNAVWTYLYENSAIPHGLTGIIDQLANRYATWTYDASGRVTSSSHAGGADLVTLGYNSDGSTTVTDAVGTARVYTFVTIFSTKKNTSISQPCAGCENIASRTYDVWGNVISKVDFQGNLSCYAYDTNRNLETVRVEGFAPTITTCPANLASYTPAAGTRQRMTTTTWNATFPFPATVVQANRTLTYSYDGSGNLLTKTITDTSSHTHTARSWTYSYGSYGQMLTSDGPRTDVVDKSIYTYYSCATGYQCGRLNSVTDPLGLVTTNNAYNAYGQLLTSTDPNGVVTNLTYDIHQRLTLRQVGTEMKSFAYDVRGLLQQITMPDGSTVQYGYDLAHRLIAITDGLGDHINYTLDAMANRTSESASDPSNVLSRIRSRAYNALNLLSQEVGSAGTAAVTTNYTYDGNGNQIGINAPLARDTTDQYDELNRLKQTTDPANGNTVLGYDANDNLTSVTDPRNLATSYAYSGFADLMSQTSPDTGTTSNAYDTGGNLATSTDARGAVSSYTYDAKNRVSTVAYKVGKTTDQTLTFTYDAGTNGKGRLTGASDANQSLSWVYDTHGRVMGKGQTIGSVTKSVGYGYTNGDLTSMITPSGQTISYAYTNGQVSQITVNGTTLLTNVVYEPFGPVRGWSWGNGSALSRLHDTDGNVSQISSAEQTSYGYDNAFRITSLTNSTVPSASANYGYDALDRLTSVMTSAATSGWTYDANGNRLTQTGATAVSLATSASSNRLTSTSGGLVRSYTYDAAGNTLTYTGTTFTYYNSGRMKTAKVGSSTTTYVYNAQGQRVEKSGGVAGTVINMYDEAGHLLGEYTGTGGLTQETIYLGDIPVATLRPSGSTIAIYYVHSDNLNTPRAITRPSDNAFAWQWHGDAFGNGTPAQNPQGLGTFVYNLRFPGQYYDSETGLNYNYFRDYDPQTGRYIESDPVGQLFYLSFSMSKLRIAKDLKPGYWNHLYNYADDQPITERDRTGLGTWELLLEVLGDKVSDHVTAASLTSAIAAVCIAEACAAHQTSLDPVLAQGNCFSILTEITKHTGGPAWVGIAGVLTNNALFGGECGDKCSEGVKKAAEKTCPNCGKQ